MAQFKHFWKVAGLLCLALCLCFTISACEEQGDDTTTTLEPTVGSSQYTVRVRTASGIALENVYLYVYTDATMEELETMRPLDENGCATFTATTSDSYAAILMGVPEGFDLQEYYILGEGENEIVLTPSVITGTEKPADKIYALGDVVYDFTITAADGNVYTLSELLQEKDAVVLNFWYLNCSPCKLEFPYLEMAYQEYSDRVEVLAINCEDGNDSELLAFRESYDLSFPVAIGEKDYWYKAAYNACPTTIVIDRYGVIVYMHTGYFTEAAPFIALFRTVTGEDYQQTLIEDINSLIVDSDHRADGTSQRPFEHSGITGLEVKLSAKSKVHYNLYGLQDTVMRIENANAYVTVNGETYHPKNGVIEVSVSCENADTPVSVVFGNSSNAKITFQVQFSYALGSVNNPISLILGDNTMKVDEINGAGKYYTYTATDSGTLSLTVQGCTEGATAGVQLNNLNDQTSANLAAEGVYDPDTGYTTISIGMNKGDVIQIVVTATAEEGTDLTQATILALASVKKGGSIIDGKTGYAVSVVDQDGKPVSNVSIQVFVGNNISTLQTDENGAASIRLVVDAYRLKLVVPVGYVADVTDYLWSPGVKTLTIRLTAIVTYNVQVQKYDGTMVSGALARIYADAEMQKLLYAISTDEEGVLSFTGPINTDYYIVFTNLGEDVAVQDYYVTAGQETLIVLAPFVPEPEPEPLKLGDQMADIIVTATDGTVYSLHALLQEKDVIVLTFWDSSATASGVHMPALQQAYEKYGVNGMVLALNPVDTEEDLQMFQSTYNLTFPVASCEQRLVDALQITEYPTTVVIDREGKICLIHSGAITDSTVYDTLFSFFTAEDYVHTVFEDLGALLNHAVLPPDQGEETPREGEAGGDEGTEGGSDPE